MGAVASGGGKGRVGGSRGEGVGIIAEEVAEVEGVGDWFCDGDGAVKQKVSGEGEGGEWERTDEYLALVVSALGSETPPIISSETFIAVSVAIVVCIREFWINLELELRFMRSELSAVPP